MQIGGLSQWVSCQKNGKIRKEKKPVNDNILNNTELQTLLIIRVFATNFAVGRFYANYERRFVKKIQHYSLLVLTSAIIL